MLIARGDCVVFERAFGMADYERGIPNTALTPFPVASTTKVVTEIITEQARARGDLSMSDPVSKWISDFPRGGDITLEDLRQHRSGLPHRVTIPEEEYEPRTAEEIAELAAERATLLFEPGSEYRYSSVGYTVLARVLELATGKSYGELIADVVLGPAGARRSFDATVRPYPDVPALGYEGDPDGPKLEPSRDLSFIVGSGSLHSTPRDLLRIVRTLLTGGYGPETKAALVRWGPSVPRQQGDNLWWGGFMYGYSTMIQHDADSNLTFILTTNVTSGVTGPGGWLDADILRVAEGRTVVSRELPDLTPFALSALTRERYRGEYRWPDGSISELRFPNASRAELVSAGSTLLVPTSETTFVAPNSGFLEYAVVFDDDGSVHGLDVVWNSQTFHLVRIGPDMRAKAKQSR